jgi:hypothetical protein
MTRALFLIAAAAVGIADAGEIVLAGKSLERNAEARAIYRLGQTAIGKATMRVQWTDVHGRMVEDSTQEYTLTDENEIPFTLDVRRARAMKNTLKVSVTLDGMRRDGRPDKRSEEAAVEFIARPDNASWWDWIILMWNPYPARDIPTLKSLGINAGQFLGRNTPPPAFLADHDMRWYAENIATDFYASYHRYFPDRAKNYLLAEAKALYQKDPTGKEAFKRVPSLSDPAWLERIRTRLIESAKMHAPWGPVFYSLGDESGIADLAAYWDFDFSDHSLAQMRLWLQEQYGTLEAMNRQWGTQFSSWERVVPDTTNEAMKRADGNWSSWADHKEWMDTEFARALKMGADAVRSVDPRAYVGIGGAQMPGWGGYDYAKLASVLTAFEPYDIGNNIEILRSIAPRTPVVTTSFASGPWEKHRVWYELLHGNRGMLIWDEKRDFVSADGKVNQRGAEAAPYYRELRSGIATLLMNSERQADRIAIHYSQSSMRTDWMLKQQPKGEAWVRRNSSTERMDSEFLRVRESWCRLIEDLGLQYNFVSYTQLEQGELFKGGYRALVLPRSSSLSVKEAAAIREFAAQGGLVLSDMEPGTHDEHSRKLERPRLAGVVQPLSLDILNYHQQRLVSKEEPVRDAVGAMLRKHGIEPELKVLDENGRNVTGVELHLFRNGGVTLAALHSNPQLRVNELGPPEFKSNERFEKARKVRLVLPRLMQAVEVRGGKALGAIREWSGTLDPYEPVVLALGDAGFSKLRVAPPARVPKGATGEVAISFAPATSAARHVLHVEVSDPAGKVVDYYSGNLVARNGRATYRVPVAVNDAAGKWRVAVVDLMTGQRQSAEIEVF